MPNSTVLDLPQLDLKLALVDQHETMMQWLTDMINQLDLRVMQLEHRQASQFLTLPQHPYLNPDMIDDENSRYS